MEPQRDADPTSELFEGRVQGLVATVRLDERPLQGLAGTLDWHLQGVLSRAIKKGFLTGTSGECVYVPVAHHGKTLHLLLMGVGGGISDGLVREATQTIQKNIRSLGIAKLGLSRKDWGSSEKEVRDWIKKNFKEGEVCLLN